MNFNEVKEKILLCQDCKDKFGFTPVPIIHGNQYSKIMQISQAPSNNVHITKRPFNDPSGAKLKYKWYQISDEVFYNEDNFYITALSHCFPGKNTKGGDNPPPLASAKKWLKQELDLVQNKLYIIIGAKAAKFLYPDRDFVELVFSSNSINDKPAIVLPHPSPLNIKWFKDHPNFEEKRLPEVRELISNVLK
ncbi:uracil-DNA glycosylase family protein [Paenibacillus solani]|uniref:Uracil-DNA glycosylase n=1 Tax=Paenibacillus solani TaxID=1705565 RepID=A0A0M1P7H9_9BACL|nr:uracil-DNA glycosylase family protein [Paenibacillus solani]KOR90290.1 uracil-DNA glycosylase [Paenibacillus solani]